MEKHLEQIVAETLAQKSYKVTLGGKEFEFNPISLSDREEISVYAAKLKAEIDTQDTDGVLLSKAIECGKFGKEIAKIISICAHLRGSVSVKKEIKKYIFFKSEVEFEITEEERRKEIYEYAYKMASTEELQDCVMKLAEQINPAFFLSIIISLNRQNTLTKTKETEATAHIS